MKTDDIAQVDQKFLNAGGKPDPDFSPEHNAAVIAKTIKKYNAVRAKKRREYQEQLAERADAAASYLKHLNQGNSTKLEDYFGKKELTRLRGQQIIAELLDRRNKILKLSEGN